MKNCPNCQREIADDMPLCGYCGQPVDAKPEQIPTLKPKKEAPKTSGTVVALLVIAIMGMLILCMTMNSSTTKKAPSTSRSVNTAVPAKVTSYSVRYEVLGSAKTVSITMENSDGGTEQRSSVTLPYKVTQTFSPGSFVYISAQNNTDTGNVICKIFVDDQEVKKSSSTGAYVIATCSGRLP